MLELGAELRKLSHVVVSNTGVYDRSSGQVRFIRFHGLEQLTLARLRSVEKRLGFSMRKHDISDDRFDFVFERRDEFGRIAHPVPIHLVEAHRLKKNNAPFFEIQAPDVELPGDIRGKVLDFVKALRSTTGLQVIRGEKKSKPQIVRTRMN